MKLSLLLLFCVGAFELKAEEQAKEPKKITRIFFFDEKNGKMIERTQIVSDTNTDQNKEENIDSIDVEIIDPEEQEVLIKYIIYPKPGNVAKKLVEMVKKKDIEVAEKICSFENYGDIESLKSETLAENNE